MEYVIHGVEEASGFLLRKLKIKVALCSEEKDEEIETFYVNEDNLQFQLQWEDKEKDHFEMFENYLNCRNRNKTKGVEKGIFSITEAYFFW